MIRTSGFSQQLKKHPNKTLAAVAHHIGCMMRRVYTNHTLVANARIQTETPPRIRHKNKPRPKQTGEITINIGMGSRNQYGEWWFKGDPFLTIILMDASITLVQGQSKPAFTVDLAHPNSIDILTDKIHNIVRAELAR